MGKVKRNSECPIPGNLKELLNMTQLATLGEIGKYGWELRFIRKPPSRDAIPVVFSGDGDQIGLLEEDGRLNLQSNIEIRECVQKVASASAA